eukprot:TRINITY_DN100858_c0_g1_i1.p1 TRINITY_DN100858_c0_g1~~TRINITY_DN100858_c0_g1_i1.p1  ORF type:complete len:318 (+),score=62.80 TRINITY_DN100858_c0_g1_i1:31-954(+)
MTSNLLRRKFPSVGTSKGALLLLFSWRGTVLGDTWAEVLSAVVVAVVITVLHALGFKTPDFSLDTHQFTIIPLGFLLVLRTSNAYRCYWDARELLLKFAYHTYEIATKARSFALSEDGNQRLADHIERLALATLALLRMELQKTYDPQQLQGLLTQEERATVMRSEARPLAAIVLLRREVQGHQRFVFPYALRSMDKDVTGLSETLTGLSAINNTPFPFPFAHHLRLTLYLWTWSLAIPLQPTVGILTPIVVLCVSFVLFGLNAAGQEIEAPLGDDVNDYDLLAYQNHLAEQLRPLPACYAKRTARA